MKLEIESLLKTECQILFNHISYIWVRENLIRKPIDYTAVAIYNRTENIMGIVNFTEIHTLKRTAGHDLLFFPSIGPNLHSPVSYA